MIVVSFTTWLCMIGNFPCLDVSGVVFDALVFLLSYRLRIGPLGILGEQILI